MSDLTNTPMAFEVIRDSIINNILVPGEQDRFRTVGNSLPIQSAESVLKNSRSVAVYISEGGFEGGSLYLPYHDMTFAIEMMVSASSEADLKILEKTFPENVQRDIHANALANMQTGEFIVDRLMDELIRIVYQLIMHAENDLLGLDRIEPETLVQLHSRMIPKFEKGSPQTGGGKVTCGTTMLLECRAEEIIGEEEPLSQEGAGEISGVINPDNKVTT